MIKQKEKPCKGLGQAIGSGCGKPTLKRTYGLCDSCYYDWLLNSEAGQVKLQKATIKGKKDFGIKEARRSREEKKAKLEKLKTHSDWLKDLQVVFNSYIRKRDEGKPCISCGSKNDSKRDAGHMFSVGANPELRFDEDNVHSQCVHCNQHKHGNVANYIINLPKRIGQKRFDELLERKGKPNKLTIPEIKEKIKHYKEKTKEHGVN